MSTQTPRERAQAALIDMVLAKAPVIAVRGEADGYAIHVVHANGAASGHHYAQDVQHVSEIGLPELAYIAEHGAPLDAEKRAEMIRDFGLTERDLGQRAGLAP